MTREGQPDISAATTALCKHAALRKAGHADAWEPDSGHFKVLSENKMDQDHLLAPRS